MIKLAPVPKTKKIEQEVSPKSKQIVIGLVLFAFLVLCVGFFSLVFKGVSSRNISSMMQVRDGIDPKQISDVVARVRELVATKADEQPTVATVQDISILRPQNPALYRDAENGDRLLVWSDKAVVYSVSKDRLLVVIPVSATPQAAPVQASPSGTEPAVTIEVRNGSATLGAARTLSDVLKADGFQALEPAEAKDKAYSATVIYNVTGKTIPKTLEKLVQATGAKVVTSLAGEKASLADLLIIVGAKD